MRCMLHISEPAIGDGTEVIFSEEGTGLKRWPETSGKKIGKIAYLRKKFYYGNTYRGCSSPG